MGLLDELEQEAQRQRVAQAQLTEQREQRERRWNEELLPAMRALDDYLQRLVRHLGALNKRPRLVYPLPGYGDVVAYIEPAFVINSAPETSSYDIRLEGVATVATRECPQVTCESASKTQSVSSALQARRLTGMMDARKGPNGEVRSATFQAKGRIPLLISVHASLESGSVRMQFENYEGFGNSSRNFRADQLTEELFDQLGRFIVREEASFGQEAVGADVRRQLQSRIQRDAIKRQWEQKLARQLGEDEVATVARLDPSIRPGGLIGRLRMLSRRLVGR